MLQYLVKIICLLTLCIPTVLTSQINTYVKSYQFSSSHSSLIDIRTQIQNNNYIIHIEKQNPTNDELGNVSIYLDFSGEIVSLFSSYKPEFDSSDFGRIENLADQNNFFHIASTYANLVIVSKLNSQGEILWGKLFKAEISSSVNGNSMGNALSNDNKYGMDLAGQSRFTSAVIDTDGNLEHLKTIKPLKLNTSIRAYNPFYSTFRELYFYTAGETEEQGVGFLYLKKGDFSEKIYKETDNFAAREIDFFSNDDLLLSGWTTQSSNSVLVRFSTDLEYIDGAELIIDSFISTYNNSSVIDANNNIYTLYRLPNRFLLAKLDENFNLIWAKTIPGSLGIFTDALQINSENRLFFTCSNPTSDGSVNVLTTYKMTLDGEINGVVLEDYCDLEIIPFETNFISYDIEESGVGLEEDIITLPFDVNLSEVTPYEFNPPTADFNLPAQICIDNCSTPTSLNNEDADAVEWFFENGEPETSEDKTPGLVCFSEPGKYLVRQTIYFNNCIEIYEDSILVLPEININMPDSLNICPDQTVTLDAQNENANDYLWSTGATSPQLNITQAGTYSVTLTNAVCTTADTVIAFAPQPEPYPIQLPADTLICQQNLPFILEPIFTAGENLTWGNEIETATLNVTESGVYRATLDLDGCTFFDEIQIEVENCGTQIYIPNVFSPNFDGYNDSFRAEGNNFTVLFMRVYDRWGGLRYESQNANAQWDGKDAETGVYVYVFEVQNTRLGTVELFKGEVNLLR